MSWHYLQVLEGDCSEPPFSDGGPSAPWKSSRSAEKSSCGGSGTACSPCSRSGTTSGPSTADLGVASWTSSLAASRANRSARPENVSARPTSEISGLKPSGSYAKWDPASSSWKTYQLSLLTNTSERFSGSFPRAGIASCGRLYRLPSLERPIGEIGSGSWATPTTADSQGTTGGGQGRSLRTDVRKWPTPNATDGSKAPKTYARGNPSLPTAAKMWPTPIVRDSGSLKHTKRGANSEGGEPLPVAVGGTLNPPWVEWLMGWPIGWTDLEPLATARFRRWSEQHGNF